MNSIPEWLAHEEGYVPGKNRDAFLDRSIRSFLSLRSRIHARSGTETDRGAGNAALHLLFTLGLILLVSLSRNPMFVLVAAVYLLVALSLRPAGEIAGILGTGLTMALLTAAILIPVFLQGNAYSFVMIPSKVLATVTAMGLLTGSTRWPRLTGALKRFFIPDVFILVLDITVRYLVLLGDFSLQMLHALKLRSVGRNPGKRAALSGIAGTMFLRSRDMAEEMHAAMVCRGFTGEYRTTERFSLGWIDGARAVVLAGLAYAFFFLERI